jgi:hypothetical protein
METRVVPNYTFPSDIKVVRSQVLLPIPVKLGLTTDLPSLGI